LNKVILLVFGLVLLMGALSLSLPRPANADVISISPSSATVTSGGAVNISLVAHDDSQHLHDFQVYAYVTAGTATVTLNDAGTTCTHAAEGAKSCGADTWAPSVANAAWITFPQAAWAAMDADSTAQNVTVLVPMTVSCTATATILVIADQEGGTPEEPSGEPDPPVTAAEGELATTVTCNPGAVQITVIPEFQFAACNAVIEVEATVTVNDAPAPNGTEVKFSVNLGTVSPASDNTTGGEAQTNYRSPASSGGIATIRAEALGSSGQADVAVACNSQPAHLGFPNAVCVGGGRANVTFPWTPTAGATEQWLDLSLFDNGFASGTYLAARMDGTQSSLTWNGLLTGLPHYWRVTSLTAEGWLFSQTGAFVPCGDPEVRGINYACTGGGQASVTFFWAASTPPGYSQWVDLSVFNNGFAGGTFIGAGPFHVSAQQVTWSGILANVTHYWRVNNFSSDGWHDSSTGVFFAAC
jgi:hypothetical protein